MIRSRRRGESWRAWDRSGRTRQRWERRPRLSRGPAAAVQGRPRGLPGLRPRAAAGALAQPSPPRTSHSRSCAWACTTSCVAFDHGSGEVWLASRAVDGDTTRLGARRTELLERLPRRTSVSRLATRSPPIEPSRPRLPPATSIGRRSWRSSNACGRRSREGSCTRPTSRAASKRPSVATRGPLYRLLRTGDPVGYAAYLDLGRERSRGGPRALLSASPEPFLSAHGRGPGHDRPDQGHAAARGHARGGPGPRRRAAGQRQGPGREHDDRGRPAQRPGPGLRAGHRPRAAPVPPGADRQRPAPRLDGDRASSPPGRDAFDLLAASFPGGSVTGAPKIRAMELIERLEPVRRGPYTGAALWMGPDGAMGSSILIRTLIADGGRLTLHVGGGIDLALRSGRRVGRDAGQGGRPPGARSVPARTRQRGLMDEPVRPASRERDLLAAVAGGVAVGLLALTLPSPVALLGLDPGPRRRPRLRPPAPAPALGVLLIAAALTAGLPSGWTLFERCARRARRSSPRPRRSSRPPAARSSWA